MALPGLQSIERLRRVAVALEAGDADARWLAARLRRYFNYVERGLTIEMALDLRTTPGAPSWFEVERRALRDDLLVQIAATHFSDLSPPRAAAALAAEWRQYERHARRADLWRGHSMAADGSLRADLFRVAVLGDLPGERRLADILRANAA